jgi:hypothetical protein
LRRFVSGQCHGSTLIGSGHDYRDADGSWKRMQPVRFQAFVADDAIRSRYWARSMIGWRRFGQARIRDRCRARRLRLEAATEDP